MLRSTCRGSSSSRCRPTSNDANVMAIIGAWRSGETGGRGGEAAVGRGGGLVPIQLCQGGTKQACKLAQQIRLKLGAISRRTNAGCDPSPANLKTAAAHLFYQSQAHPIEQCCSGSGVAAAGVKAQWAALPALPAAHAHHHCASRLPSWRPTAGVHACRQAAPSPPAPSRCSMSRSSAAMCGCAAPEGADAGSSTQGRPGHARMAQGRVACGPTTHAPAGAGTQHSAAVACPSGVGGARRGPPAIIRRRMTSSGYVAVALTTPAGSRQPMEQARAGMGRGAPLGKARRRAVRSMQPALELMAGACSAAGSSRQETVQTAAHLPGRQTAGPPAGQCPSCLRSGG